MLMLSLAIAFTSFTTTGVVHDDTLNQERDAATTYYVEAGSYGTVRETRPPRYVKEINGLLVGLDSRARFEFRSNDLRKAEALSTDLPLLLRQRLFVGMDNEGDRFRFGMEVEDARVAFSQYPLGNRDVNQTELIQAYVGLHMGTNTRPISLRFGRMAFEFIDRRLIALNQWRNTTNNFAGLYAAWGEDRNDWQVDLMALRPITRYVDKFDQADQHRLFFAAIGHWRRWSDWLTVEPYVMSLRQQADVTNQHVRRDIHSVGARCYAWIGRTGINYDVSGVYQFGRDNGSMQRAYAYTAEVGYSVTTGRRRPRLSASFGYASGDRDPNDGVSNRFDRYFGFGRPWSPDDYVIMENIAAPKLKIEFQQQVGAVTCKIDGGYSGYWLASRTDRFHNLLGGLPQNRDKTGGSGKFMGYGADMRIQFAPLPFINATVGYSHFFNGEFVKTRQLDALGDAAPQSDFAYIELSLNVAELITRQL